MAEISFFLSPELVEFASTSQQHAANAKQMLLHCLMVEDNYMGDTQPLSSNLVFSQLNWNTPKTIMLACASATTSHQPKPDAEPKTAVSA
jgi:hypothetical protein